MLVVGNFYGTKMQFNLNVCKCFINLCIAESKGQMGLIIQFSIEICGWVDSDIPCTVHNLSSIQFSKGFILILAKKHK